VAGLGAIGVGVDAVGDDGERKVRHEAAKGGGIGLGDGEDVIGAAADVGFVAAEAAGLEEGVGSAEPALGGAEVGEEGAVLEEVLAVEVIKDDAGAGPGGLEDWEEGGHLDATDVDDIEGFAAEPVAERLGVDV
jgi:hypothetical protein